ncbi:MAG: hypothetical protein ACJAZP_001881 [Psychromonas sp.]|jgi:hypothetical protein|uniref:hypothetical protein n=1 Tax=Psychromonas sp. TaxID=1884585 RepID=UPI0039E45E26
MSLTANEAKDLIAKLDNPSEASLLNIVNQVGYDAAGQSAENATTFFFSGNVGDLDGKQVNANKLLSDLSSELSDSSLAKFNSSHTSEVFDVVNSEVFENKLTEAFGGDEIKFNEFMDGKPDPTTGIRDLGYFDTLSANLASNAFGDVVTITPQANNLNSVWNRSELPALLDNPKVTSINGIPKGKLLAQFEAGTKVGTPISFLPKKVWVSHHIISLNFKQRDKSHGVINK